MRISVELEDLGELSDEDYGGDIRSEVRRAVRDVIVKTVREEMEPVKRQVQAHLKSRFDKLLAEMIHVVDEMPDKAVLDAMWGKE